MIRPVHHSLASIVACKSKLNIEKKEKKKHEQQNFGKTYSLWSLSITNLCLCLFVDGVDLKLIVVVAAGFEHFAVVVIVALYDEN